MSPSSDIETLFGHFGGNAGDYQEIGRENEASSARTRWPLLVTLDLTQPSIPAIPTRRDPLAKADEAAQAQSPAGDALAANGPAEAGRTGTQQVRSKTPLFTRPHRRTIPPVGNAVKSEAPRGAERFSALPLAVNAELAAGEVQPVVAPVIVSPPAVAPQAPVPPVVAASVPPVSRVPPAIAAAIAPVAVSPVVARATSAAPALRTPAPIAPATPVAQTFAAPATSAVAARTGVAPTPARAQPAPPAFTFMSRTTAPAASPSPAAQPTSILGKLFEPAAPSTAPAAQTPATEAAPAALGSLFDRLRGETSTPATPAPHSWLTNGPRRS